MYRRRSGFTLIELLIVIAIIGILIASIAVAVTKAKEFANNSDQKNNMKNLATACRVAEGFNNNRMPPAYGTYNMPPKNPTTGISTGKQATANVFVHLLPNLENKPAFDAIASGATGMGAGTFSIKVFQSAMDPSLPANPVGVTSFVANLRVFQTASSKIAYNQQITVANTADAGGVNGSDKISDGASNTIFFATAYASCNGNTNPFNGAPTNGPFVGVGPYTSTSLPSEQTTKTGGSGNPPYQIAPSLATTGSNVCDNTNGLYGHSFGSTPMSVAMGDTSVRNLSFMITGETYMRALCPNDGQPLGSDW